MREPGSPRQRQVDSGRCGERPAAAMRFAERGAAVNTRRSQGRPNAAEVDRRFRPRAVAVFAFGLLSLLLALSFPNPTAQADPMEIDQFPNSLAKVEVHSPLGVETVTLTGPTTVEVDLGSLVPADPPAREEIQTEIVSMQLTGRSPKLGNVTLRLRDQAKRPFQRTVGDIEEKVNVQKGRLDLLGDNPPLCVEHPSPPPNCVGTTADSFFDVYFEVEVSALPGQVMHNEIPKHMEETITHKPPASNETYENPDLIPLLDEDGNPTGVQVGATFHTPCPKVGVGGIAELPEAVSDSGWSAGGYAALAGGLAAAVLALGAGAWYARRRWVR